MRRWAWLPVDLAFGVVNVLALKAGGPGAPVFAFLLGYIGRIGLVPVLLAIHSHAPAGIQRTLEWLCPPRDPARRFSPRSSEPHGVHAHLAILFMFGLTVVLCVYLWEGDLGDEGRIPGGAVVASLIGATQSAASYLGRSLVLRRIHLDFAAPRAYAWEDAFEEEVLTTITLFLLLMLSFPFIFLRMFYPGAWGAWVPACTLVLALHYHRGILGMLRRWNGVAQQTANLSNKDENDTRSS